MSQRVKRPNRSEDGSVPVKRRKRTAAEEEEAAALAASAGAAWQPRSNDMKSIYNRTTTEAPAELFRKDLISAMKLPDSEPLANDEYWVIVDQWKQEWERGVQVPVNPDSLPEPSVTVTHCNNIKVRDFKLPKNKYIRITKDDNFKPEEHEFSTAPAQAEAACSYDLDECDVAWLRILNAERASAGLGPVKEDQLERVMERFEECCWDKIQSILRNEEGLGIEYDENVICDVCRSPDSEEGNEMVFCDSCNICVHQACYGITQIPDGQWLCCTCNIGKRPECVLCPNKGGAMKCTRSGQKWAHVSCALWIPEVSIGCVEKMEPITKISSIPQSRWALICVLCRERVGACIQCSVKTCKTAYHVTCAFKHGLEMRAIIEDENADDGVKLRSYCEKHSKSSKKEKSICSGSEDDDCKRKKRKDMTSEEKNQARAARLQEIEAEFYKHVAVKDVVGLHMDVDNEALQYIYNYWKLKRKAGNNKPLLPPKSDDVDMLSHKREQADLEKMKMFVQLRQDLERVRNLCYMVSRREKLSRTFFRMREQTFHKQAAVLEASNSLPTTVIQAVIEANHGPSIYDRLYSHNESEDHTSDFDSILARIAGIKSPSHSGDEKKEVNGLLKDVRNNPYKKVYYNGSLKRRSGSLYGSGMSSSSSSDERMNDSKGKENRLQSSSEDEKAASRKKPTTSPPKKNAKPVERRKKPISKSIVDSSSEEDVRQPVAKKDWRLSKIARDSGDSGSESDDIMLIRPPKKNDTKAMASIYSDSDSTDSSTKNDDKSSNATNDSQSKLRTKAAVKEFSHKPSSSKNKTSPEPKKKSKPDDKSKKKDYVPSDLIVPQRQAAKKATENLKSTTNARVKDQTAPPTEPEKPEPIKPQKPKSKPTPPSKVEEMDKADMNELLAYVPQRQAAKKAAEHIKTGMGKHIPPVEAATPAPEEPEKPPASKPKPAKVPDQKRKSSSNSSSSSSSTSSSDSTSSSSSDSDEEPPKAQPRSESPLSASSTRDSTKRSNAKDWPFLDKGSKPAASSSSSDSSDSSPPSSPPQPKAEPARAPETRQPPSPVKSHTKSPDKKQLTPTSRREEHSKSPEKKQPTPVTSRREEHSRSPEKKQLTPTSRREDHSKSPDKKQSTPTTKREEHSRSRQTRGRGRPPRGRPRSGNSGDRLGDAHVRTGDSPDSKRVSSANRKGKHADNKTADTKHADTKQPDNKHVDNKHADHKQADNKHTDTKQTDNKHIDHKLPDNKLPANKEKETKLLSPVRKTDKKLKEDAEISNLEKEILERKAEKQTRLFCETPPRKSVEKELPKKQPVKKSPVKTKSIDDIFADKLADKLAESTKENRMDDNIFASKPSEDITIADKIIEDDLKLQKSKDVLTEELPQNHVEASPIRLSKDMDFDIDNFGDTKEDEIIKGLLPFTTHIPLVKGDTKEDSARETLNLVEKLRMGMSKKPSDNCEIDLDVGPPLQQLQQQQQQQPQQPQQQQQSEQQPQLQQPLVEENPPQVVPVVEKLYEPPPPSTMDYHYISCMVNNDKSSLGDERWVPPSEAYPNVQAAEPPPTNYLEQQYLRYKNAEEPLKSQSPLLHDRRISQTPLIEPTSMDCMPSPSPYSEIHPQAKWADRVVIPNRRSSSSSAASTSSSCSRKGDPEDDLKPMLNHQQPVETALQSYMETYPSFSVSPVSLFPPAATQYLYPPPFGAPFPNTHPMSALQKPPEENMSYSTTCTAAFTSSQHNIALTTAMVSLPTAEVTKPNEDLPVPTPAPTPVTLPSPSSSLKSNSSAGKKSPSKPTRMSARVTSQNKSPGVTPQNKSPGKSPRQDPILKQGSGRGRGESRRGHGKSGAARGGGVSRGRGRGRGRGRTAHMDDSIHNKLVGTVYDFDFEDDNSTSMTDLKSMRERRKSSDHNKFESTFMPPQMSPKNRSYNTELLRPPTPIEDVPKSDGLSLSAETTTPLYVAPVLPGPVDMRTYNSNFDQQSYNDNLLGAFANETTGARVHEDIDEDFEKELHSALTAKKPEPQPPEISSIKVSLSDTRNQLKFKIKGPIANNYTSTVAPLPAASTIEPVTVSVTANSVANNVSNNAASSGTSHLRRMRKKELLRQYCNEDMNMDDSVNNAIPAMPPINRTIITIPKAVASMTSIPTKDDYRDYQLGLDDHDTKHHRKDSKSRAKHLDLSLDDDQNNDRRKSLGLSTSLDSGLGHKRRGRPPRPQTQHKEQQKEAQAPPTSQPQVTPKLKIKIGGNSVVDDKKDRIRPPKKRLAAALTPPSVEDLKRESMKFRKQVMADLKVKKKKKDKTEKKKKKKAKSEVQIISNQSDNPTKLIIRFGLGKKPEGDSEKRTSDGDATTAESAPSVAVSDNKIRTENTECAKETSDVVNKENSGASPPKVTPIKLKLSRCVEGSGYVMKPSSGQSGCVATTEEAQAVQPGQPPPVDPPPLPPPTSLPLNKDCEVR